MRIPPYAVAALLLSAAPAALAQSRGQPEAQTAPVPLGNAEDATRSDRAMSPGEKGVGEQHGGPSGDRLSRPADPSRPVVQGPPPAAGGSPTGETTATSADPIPSLADDAEDRPEAPDDVGERPDMTGDRSHRVDPAGVREPIKPAPYPYFTGDEAGRTQNPDRPGRELLPGHEPEDATRR